MTNIENVFCLPKVRGILPRSFDSIEKMQEMQERLSNSRRKGDYYKYKNICEIIEDLCQGGNQDYLTARGQYIVLGGHFSDTLEEYYNKWMNYSCANLQNEEDRAFLNIEWIDDEFGNMKTFQKKNNVSDDERIKLDQLREQYLAISEWTKDPNDENKRKNVIEKYNNTGTNVLTYLKDLKKGEDWTYFTNLDERDVHNIDKGIILLGFIFTGRIPDISTFHLNRYYNDNSFYNRAQGGNILFLSDIRGLYLSTIYLVDQMVKEKNQSLSSYENCK